MKRRAVFARSCWDRCRIFLANEDDRTRALKRGGGWQILSFDEHLAEAEAAMLATVHLDDVSCYDLTWASNVVTRAWQHLRQRFVAEAPRRSRLRR